MLRKASPQQAELERVTLGQLVPRDPLLRKVEAACGFIREMPEVLYCPDRTILGVTGDLRPSKPKAILPKRLFRHDADDYRCCEDQMIPCPTTDHTGHRHSKSDPRLTTLGLLSHPRQSAENGQPPRLGRCPPPDRMVQDLVKKMAVECSFAHASQLFGHPYARLRSVPKVRTNCLRAATGRNIEEVAVSTPNGAGQTA